jgi:hypothetical protein
MPTAGWRHEGSAAGIEKATDIPGAPPQFSHISP